MPLKYPGNKNTQLELVYNNIKEDDFNTCGLGLPFHAFGAFSFVRFGFQGVLSRYRVLAAHFYVNRDVE